jgi:DNA-binding NarL/FixJ family response regulator
LIHPTLKIVVIDESVVEAHVHEVLRLDLLGYLTKEQPLSDVIAALRRARYGERVFIPTIAARLTLGGNGVRLEPLHEQGPLARLTPRERDVLVHVAQGNSVKRCAELLGISPSTVDNHKSRLMRKLHVHKAVELTHFAIREGLIHHPIAGRMR